MRAVFSAVAAIGLVLTASGFSNVGGADPGARFRRGDANGDGRFDQADAVRLLDYLYRSKSIPVCKDAGDANDDGVLNLSDAIYALSYLLLGGPEPPAPFPACGPDPTGDALDCGTYEQNGSHPCVDVVEDPVETFEETVHFLTNEKRAENGLPPLKHNPLLAEAMREHLEDMAAHGYFSHVSLDGRQLPDRVEATGYDWNSLGENIAAGFLRPETVVESWMGSPTHRENILSSRFREMGASHVFNAASTYDHYWGQDFGSQPNVYPVVIDLEAPSTPTVNVTLYIHGTGWAKEMQVANDRSFSGAAWRPFQATLAWTLTAGRGTKTVYVRIRNGATVLAAQDTIRLE